MLEKIFPETEDNLAICGVFVADYVWNEVLKTRESDASYWQLPGANHYLQNDQPEILNLLIRQALGESVDMETISLENRPVRMK